MLKPSINEVLNKIDNRYYLVGTVAKRAREIVDGSDLYIMNRERENKAVNLATREVAEGKISYRILTQEEVEMEEARQLEEQLNDTQEV